MCLHDVFDEIVDLKSVDRLSRLRTTWDARHVVLVIGAFVLALLVGYPMASLALKSLPLSNYVQQLRAPQTWLALRNTLYIAGGATALATLLGATLAFLVTRTDMPFRRWVHAGTYFIFLTPGYIATVAWIQLLGRSGHITRWLRMHMGLLRPPVNIYSLEGVIVVMGLYLMPLVYMATGNALRNSDPALEEAAIASGATQCQTIATVTLPLALPGILSGASLVLIHGLAGFGAPAALAMPTGNLVLTTQIYAALGHYDVRMACAQAVLLALIVALTLAAHNALLRVRRRAVTASPDLQRCTLHLGLWGYAIGGVALLLLTCASVLPLITILASSLLKAWGLPIRLGNLTLGNYLSIFTVGLGARALRNSFFYALVGATAATLLGFLVAYISTRTQLAGRKALDFLASMPSAIPGPVLAAAMIFAWMLPPLELYNTPWIILVAYVVAFLPYPLRNVVAALRSADSHLEEMGWMCGGSWLVVLRDVVVPGVRDSIWTGWTLVFLMAFREIPLSTMLYTEGTETVGVLLFLLRTESGGLEVTSAVATVVMLLTVVGQLTVKQASQRSSPMSAAA
jgi:iron(III) transport system permease protein